VTFADGRQLDGTVVGADPVTDLAVVRVSRKGELKAAPLGDSEALEVGDWAIALGSPYGLERTVTLGIVSSLHRDINSLGFADKRLDLIQTDAAINPGNSGGALVDVQGNLLGINTAIYSKSGGSMGIGFAIPVSIAKQVLEGIVKDGLVTRGWIGVEPTELTPELAQTFNVNRQEGVIITGVLQTGPAFKAGVRPGDMLLAVNDHKVQNVAELLAQVSMLKPGVDAQLKILRKEQEQVLSVTPLQRPKVRAERR
jgi:S1-C subfamily serine protease